MMEALRLQGLGFRVQGLRFTGYKRRTNYDGDVDAIFDVDQLGDALDVNLHGLLQPTCSKSFLSVCTPPPPAPPGGQERAHARMQWSRAVLPLAQNRATSKTHPCVCVCV